MYCILGIFQCITNFVHYNLMHYSIIQYGEHVAELFCLKAYLQRDTLANLAFFLVR